MKTREIIEAYKAEIIKAQEYLSELRKVKLYKGANSLKYTISHNLRTIHMGKHKVLDKRKFLKVVKKAAKEMGAVFEQRGNKVSVSVSVEEK